MLTGRRAFFTSAATGGCAMTVLRLLAPAHAQEPDSASQTLAEFGFVGPEDDPKFGPLISGRASETAKAVGPDLSRHDEVAAAFRILFDVDRSQGPLGAARYFEGIKQKNREGELYNWEWRERANPVITGFFSMTNTLPSKGDQTPWCAAFVNFCLYVTGKSTTFSALSGRFRDYGQPTSSPEPGDLAVFSNYGEDGNKGFGHVGFYLGRTGETIKVLGGNQSGETGSSGAIVETDYSVSGRRLFLVGFRKVSAS